MKRLVLATCAAGLVAVSATGQAMAQLGLGSPVGAGDASGHVAALGASANLPAPVAAVAETVGQAPASVGSAAPALAPVLDTAQGAAAAAGSTVAGARPSALPAAPVVEPVVASTTRTVEGTTEPLAPVTRRLEPVTRAVTETAASLTRTVDAVARPVAGPAEPLLEPLTGTIAELPRARDEHGPPSPAPEASAQTSPESAPVAASEPADAPARSASSVPAPMAARSPSPAASSTHESGGRELGPLSAVGPTLDEPPMTAATWRRPVGEARPAASADRPNPLPLLPERAPGGLAPGSASPGSGGALLFAALAACLLLAAPGLGRRLRPTLAPPLLPHLHLSLERPG